MVVIVIFIRESGHKNIVIVNNNFKNKKSIVLDGWVDVWMDVKAVLRIAHINQKMFLSVQKLQIRCKQIENMELRKQV